MSIGCRCARLRLWFCWRVPRLPIHKPSDDAVLISRIREIALTQVRYGYWRIYTLQRCEGWAVNHKNIYRLYKLEGLNLLSKRPRRNRAAAHCLDRVVPSDPHQSWRMDFVVD